MSSALPSTRRAVITGIGPVSAIGCGRNAFCCFCAGMRIRCPARERREDDADGFTRWIGPTERTRGASMAERLVRTSRTARRSANGEAQPAGPESLPIVVPGHQLCGLGANDLAAKMKKLA